MKRSPWDMERKTNPCTTEKFSGCEDDYGYGWDGETYREPEYEQPESGSIEAGHSGTEPMHKRQLKLRK